jgi:heme oxygenase
MVAYAYDMIERRNPLGFFGMVFVLEGTSVALALSAADRIQARLQLPNQAFSYLRSHGTLDQQHVGDLEAILGRLDEPQDRDAVIRCAKAMFWLYGNVFRSLEAADAAAPAGEPARRRA